MGLVEGVAQVGEIDHAESTARFSSQPCENDSPTRRAKVTQILACCQGWGKRDQLASLATATSGLVNDEVRRLACMFGTNRPDKLP
jgi:hypothetical protein